MKRKIFVILPFQDGPLHICEEIKKQFKDRFEINNAGDLDSSQSILKDIVKGIADADFIIADLTSENPNVFYELGLAHALNKQTIIITQSIGSLPFDIQSYRAIEYSTEFYKVNDLFTKLDNYLSQAESGEVSFGNPVSDFAPEIKIVNKSNSSQITDAPQEFSSKKTEESTTTTDNADFTPPTPEEIHDIGFLDALEDLDGSIATFNTEYEKMSSDLDSMNTKISDSAEKIVKIKKNNSPNITNLIRLECRNAGQYVQTCSNSFKQHIDEVDKAWMTIENRISLLMDNPYILNSGQLEDLDPAIDQLIGLKEQIQFSNSGVLELSSSMQSIRGVERSLTAAVESMLTQLERYLTFTDVMLSGIDRIENKWKTINSIES